MSHLLFWDWQFLKKKQCLQIHLHGPGNHRNIYFVWWRITFNRFLFSLQIHTLVFLIPNSMHFDTYYKLIKHIWIVSKSTRNYWSNFFWNKRHGSGNKRSIIFISSQGKGQCICLKNTLPSILYSWLCVFVFLLLFDLINIEL